MEMIYLPKSKGSMREIKRAFSIDRMIREKKMRIDRGRALRILPDDIENNMIDIKKHLYRSTGLQDDREYDDRYRKLVNGLDISNKVNAYDEFQKATDDVSFMKRGAANAGNIGMTLRGLARTVKEMRLANDIYHKLAQTALDGKNGQSNKDLVNILCDAIRFGNIANMNKYAKEIFNDDEIEYLMKQMTDGNRVVGIARKFARNHPIGHITTTGGIRDANRTSTYKGVYEKLYELAYNRLHEIEKEMKHNKQ